MSCKGKGGKQQVEIACAGRGFHIYLELWKLKLGQTLQIRKKIRNLHDIFAIPLGAKIPRKLTDFDVVGHIPWEMNHFCHYFLNYGGKFEVCV